MVKHSSLAGQCDIPNLRGTMQLTLCFECGLDPENITYPCPEIGCERSSGSVEEEAV